MSIERLRDLAHDLDALVDGIATEVTEFPSGAGFLDVRLNGRSWVVEYSPSWGFGVDELRENEGFNTGYPFVTQDFQYASNHLMGLIRTAQPQRG